MIRCALKLVGLLCLGFAATASGYEVITHQEMAKSAVAASALSKTPDVLKNLGLDDISKQVFPVGNTSLSIPAIVGEGAIAEDDFPRPVNHFFDPTHAGSVSEGAARSGFLAIGIASPTWALEDRGAQPQQDNSLIDARKFLLAALTSSDKLQRDTNFVSMFRTLGNVSHHLQDMAQPQHVRNDLHCISVLCRPLFLHNPSAFERYTEEKIRRGFALGNHASLYTSNSAILNSARKFWITGDGRGISEFTNRNFVSAGTNFRYESGAMLPDAEYGHPAPQATADMATVSQAYAAAERPVPPEIQQLCVDDCWIEFVASTGTDYLSGQSFTNPRASSLSIFDQDLQLRTVQIPWSDGEGITSTQRFFSLNSLNFDEAHKLLFRRAVGYSAGLIDYFFRGKIDLLLHPSDQAQYLIKNLGTEPMKGKFKLYYDDSNLTRREVKDASGLPVVWDTVAIVPDGILPPGATMPVSAFPAQTPAPKTLGEYMLVFTGDMGEERADADNGVVGAVVSKKVGTPYAGVLYFVGLDAANQRHYFKLDRNGLSTIGPNEVNPLVPPSPREFGTPWAIKQSFVDGAPGSAAAYKTAALVLSNVSIDPDYSLVADLATGALAWKSGIRWLARSPDPAIGSFEFTLNIFNTQGTLAFISYIRRYMAGNQVAQTSGTVVLPELTAAVGFSYNNIRLGGSGVGLDVTDNGTMLYPEANTHFGIQITLGAQPSAALFTLPDDISTSRTEPSIGNSGSTGATCTLAYVEEVPGVGKVDRTVSSNWLFSEGYSESESFTEAKGIAGVAYDRPIIIQSRMTKRSFRRHRTDSCLAVAIDQSGSTPRTKVHAEFQMQTEQPIAREEVVYVLGDGSMQFPGQMQHIEDLVEVASETISYCGEGDNPPVGGPSAIGTVDFVGAGYSYSGFCPTPRQSAPYYRMNSLNPNNLSLPKRRPVRPLNHDIEDAIYEEAIPGTPIVLKFKNVVLPTLYAVETSPLGEVLIANNDLTLLEHHPKYGMPVLRRDMLPADIVAVGAWLWL